MKGLAPSPQNNKVPGLNLIWFQLLPWFKDIHVWIIDYPQLAVDMSVHGSLCPIPLLSQTLNTFPS